MDMQPSPRPRISWVGDFLVGRYWVTRLATPKGKLLESEMLRQQANNNTKEQFSNSPDLQQAILGAVMDALAAHTVMSSQALDSQSIRDMLKEILLGPGRLYEALRG